MPVPFHHQTASKHCLEGQPLRPFASEASEELERKCLKQLADQGLVEQLGSSSERCEWRLTRLAMSAAHATFTLRPARFLFQARKDVELQNLSMAELLEMLSYQDKDSSGVIDFMEFLKLMEKRARMAHKMDEYKSLFNNFDKDRKSMVSEVEIRYIVRKHPTLSKMPAQLLDDVILQADT